MKADINKQIQVEKVVFQSYHNLSLRLFYFNEFTWLSHKLRKYMTSIFLYKPHYFCCYDEIASSMPSYKRE